jgi:hypothetical protein
MYSDDIGNTWESLTDSHVGTRQQRDINLSPVMGTRNQLGTGLSYRAASLCSLATQFQTRFPESIPRPIAEPVFVNVYGAQASIPRNRFRQPM